ncbi:MAG: O-antigen ligase family protein [Candidatus Omnitrophota bacterium]
MFQKLIWPFFLLIIFFRPFISSLTYPIVSFYYNIVLVIISGAYLISEQRKTNFSVNDLPLTTFIFAVIFSNIFSIEHLVSLNVTLDFIIFILIFLLVRAQDEKKKRQLIFTIIFASILICLYALYQYSFGFEHALNLIQGFKISYPYAQYILTKKRVLGPFFSADMLASYLSLIIPVVIAFLLSQKNKILSIIYYLISTVLLLVSLFLAQSFGTILSLFLGLLLFYFLSKPLRKKLTWPLLVIFIFGLSVVFLRWNQFSEPISPHNPFLKRMTYWKQSLEILKLHPIVGIGLGNFEIPRSFFAHNSYLQLWIETGILGFLSFLWFILDYLWQALKRIRKNPQNYFLTAAFVSIIVFLIHNILDFSFFIPEVALTWWVILGVLSKN